jgi:hypothetical protein
LLLLSISNCSAVNGWLTNTMLSCVFWLLLKFEIFDEFMEGSG